MLNEIACTCESEGCEEALDADNMMLAFETEAGTRRAYECDCGAVTITVSK